MNFLAHSYLSFNNEEVLIGNMISDFVKGKKKYDYSAAIQKGIQLHRDIDAYTDQHLATKEANEVLKPAVGLYAGAFIDVVYDHFLANDEKEFTDSYLNQHATSTYGILSQHYQVLPLKFQTMLPFMTAQNWLYNYKKMHGIQNSFAGLVKRASYLHTSSEVFQLFQSGYSSLQKCYNAFFSDVKAFALEEFNRVLK